jgi:hypothetical protein
MYQAKKGLKIGQSLIFLSEIFLQAGMSSPDNSRFNEPVLDGKASQLCIVSQVEFPQ